MKLPRQLVPVLLLGIAALAALAVGYWNIRPASFAPTPLVDDSDRPDFFMENARILTLDSEGRPHHELNGDSARYYRQPDITRIENPVLTFNRKPDEQPWTLSALQGLVSDNGQRVELLEQVQLQQQHSGRQLLTEALILYPQRDYAETSHSVRLEAPRQVTTAEGMQVYLEEGRLELLSKVRGEHEPR